MQYNVQYYCAFLGCGMGVSGLADLAAFFGVCFSLSFVEQQRDGKSANNARFGMLNAATI
jgi:hypothetical protein